MSSLGSTKLADATCGPCPNHIWSNPPFFECCMNYGAVRKGIFVCMPYKKQTLIHIAKPKSGWKFKFFYYLSDRKRNNMKKVKLLPPLTASLQKQPDSSQQRRAAQTHLVIPHQKQYPH